jgi:predicted ABC-type sugar transport system permease subunit
MTNQTVIKVGSTATGFWGKLRTVLARRTEGRAIVLFAIIATFVTVSQPLVFTAYQVTLGRIALIGLVALGLTAVILMGELDLSVASTLAVSGVIAVTVANQTNMAIGVLAALAAGVVVSLINAFFVAIVGINSFIATLGMLFALRGMAFVISDEAPVKLQNTDLGIAFGLLPDFHCNPDFCFSRQGRSRVLGCWWEPTGCLRCWNPSQAKNLHRFHYFWCRSCNRWNHQRC